MRTLLLTFAVGGMLVAGAVASDACKSPEACTVVETCGSEDCCGRCGRHGCCHKYCKVVCEMKEVKKTVWVVKCEEFCTSLPNCGKHCQGNGGCDACANCTAEPTCCNDCNGCQGKCDPCAAEKNKTFIPPKCGKMRVKKTLEKKEVVCKVPSYKCVVVYACADCGANECGGQNAAPATPEATPPAPAPSKTTHDTLTPPMPPILGVSYVE